MSRDSRSLVGAGGSYYCREPSQGALGSGQAGGVRPARDPSPESRTGLPLSPTWYAYELPTATRLVGSLTADLACDRTGPGLRWPWTRLTVDQSAPTFCPTFTADPDRSRRHTAAADIRRGQRQHITTKTHEPWQNSGPQIRQIPSSEA